MSLGSVISVTEKILSRNWCIDIQLEPRIYSSLIVSTWPLTPEIVMK